MRHFTSITQLDDLKEALKEAQYVKQNAYVIQHPVLSYYSSSPIQLTPWLTKRQQQRRFGVIQRVK